MSNDVEIAIVGTNAVGDALRVVPLIENRFDPILSSSEEEPDGAFIDFAARVALHG